MANVLDIIIKTTDKTNFSAVKSGLKDAGSSAKRAASDLEDVGIKSAGAGSKMGGLSSIGASLGEKFGELAKKALMMGGAFSAMAGAKVLADWTKKAADAGETFSKASTIFKSNFGDIEKFANGSAKSLGLSKNAALDAVGTYGNMFDQLGFGGQQVSSMSQKMVQLAADFGSFHNADIKDVIDAQSSAFRGEYDALQKFVPTISAATVQQKAMEMTGKKSANQLTAQEKAAATYAYMIEHAGQAQGDFARTSDSAANKQKIANAAMDNASVSVGAKLLPVMQKLNEAKLALATILADKIVPALSKVSQFIQDNQALFTAAAVLIGGALTAAFISWAASAAVAAAATLAATWPLLAIGAAVAALAYIVIKNWDTIKAATTVVWDAIKAIIGVVLDAIGAYIRFYVAAYMAIWNGIKATISAIWDFCKTIVNLALQAIGAYIQFYVSIYSAVWNGIKAVISAVWNFIKNLISGAMAAIQGNISSQVSAIIRLWDSIRSAVSGLWDRIKGIVSGAMDTIYNNTVGRITAITDKISGLVKKISSISVGGIKSKLSGLPGFATGGVASGGYALVGERGPELRSLQPGERIKSNPTSRAELSQSKYQSGVGNPIIVNVHGSILSERDIVGVIRDAIRDGAMQGVLR